MGGDRSDFGRLAILDHVRPNLVIFSQARIGSFEQSILFREPNFRPSKPFVKLVAFPLKFVNVLFSLDMEPVEIIHVGKL